jgi:hypothetical protein
MRFPALGVAVAAAVSIAILAVPGQQSGPEQKHIIVSPQNAARLVQAEARSIERGLPYPSVVTLKGNVRIKTPVCLPVGPQDSMICDGYMIVQADAAEIDEKSGEIRPQGNVVITPIYHEKK